MDRAGLQALCKRHGLSAGGSNADLIGRLDAALSRAATVGEVAEVAARKGCLKQRGGDTDEEKKVTFAVEEGMVRRLRSRVICCLVVPKTMGKPAQDSTDSTADDADVPVRRSRRNSLGPDVPVRRSRRNSLGPDVRVRRNSLGADVHVSRSRRNSLSAEAQDCELRSRVIWSPVVAKTGGESAQAGSVEVGADVPLRRSSRNLLSAAEAEEVEVAVAVDRKRKRKNQENDEGVAVSAQVGALSRVARRSSLVGAAALLPPAVGKKRGTGEAAGVQKSAQVEVSARITRSRTTPPVVTSPTVVENKRRKTGDARTNVEQSTVSDVPTNDARVTKSLRNRAVQVNKSMADETHAARQLENKTQPSRLPTRRRQQVSSSVEGKNQEEIAAPNKDPLLRRSGRNYSEDVEKQPAVKEPVRRSTRKSVVLANDLIEQKNPEAHVRRSMRKSIVPVKDIKDIGEEIQNASSEDAAKQPATKRPVRGSRRKSVVSELHEKEKGLIAEKNIEAHEGKSMWKPVMPVKYIKAVGKGIKSAVKVANDDIVIMEATKDTHRATHEYNKESSSKVQEICQVNATREEFSSGPLLETLTLTNEICTTQSIHEVIPGSESGDNTKESLGKSKQPQEHRDIQAVDSHLSETRNGELDQSLCIAELVRHNCVVLEGKALRSEGEVNMGANDGYDLSIDLAVGDHEEQSFVSREGRVGLEANAIESGEKNLAGVMSTGLYTKSLQHDIDIVAEETGKDVMPMAFTIEGHREIDGENGENEPSEDDDVQPTRCDTDKKFDVDQGVAEENTAVEIDGGNKPSTPVTPVTNLSPAEEEVLAQEKCNDQHVPAKTDLKLKLNDELAGPCMESGCSIIEKNEMLVSDNLDQEGDFKKPSLCSATPEWKHECGLPEETVLPSKNMGSLPSAEQSPFGLESLFSQESIDESVGHGALASATAHTENGFDDSKDCHVKSALENAHVSEPFSHHDTKGGISRNVDCMHTSQQYNGMEDAIENPSISLSTPGYKHDGALSEEAVRPMKDYAGTCSSNPREVSDICAMSEAAPIEVLETGIAVEMSSLLEGRLNPELDGDEVEKHSLNCETDTSRILGTGSVMSKTALLPKDAHAISCQELELPNGLSLFKFAEESVICQYVSVSGSGPCHQRVNESTSMQTTYNIETLNQHPEEYNQNNEDQTTPGFPASSVPEAVETEHSEMEIGLIPAAEASVLPVPDVQLNSKEGNEVDEHSCSYGTELLNREASNLHKDDCMDNPNDLPALRSPQQSAYFQDGNESGSVGICQSSRRGRGIDELRAKRQSFKVSSTIKGSYIAKSVPRLKPGDSLTQSAIALRRNRGNTTAVKVGHPVKPNADRSVTKDSSIRGLQPISRGRIDSLSQSAIALPRNIKNTTAVKSKANKPWL